MASNYDSTDLSWSWKGDLKVVDGDLSLNSSDALESIEAEIITIIKSSNGDWELHPMLGANLWRFVGEANTRENAERIKDAIITSLVSSGIVRRADIEVDINAMSLHALYIKVRLKAIATTNNRLMAPKNNPDINQYNEGVELKFLFDTNTSAIFW